MMGDDGEYVVPRGGPSPVIPPLQQLHMQTMQSRFGPLAQGKRPLSDLSSDSGVPNDADFDDNDKNIDKEDEDDDLQAEPPTKKARLDEPVSSFNPSPSPSPTPSPVNLRASGSLHLESEEILDSPLLTPSQEEVPSRSPFAPSVIITVSSNARATIATSVTTSLTQPRPSPATSADITPPTTTKTASLPSLDVLSALASEFYLQEFL